ISGAGDELRAAKKELPRTFNGAESSSPVVERRLDHKIDRTSGIGDDLGRIAVAVAERDRGAAAAIAAAVGGDGRVSGVGAVVEQDTGACRQRGRAAAERDRGIIDER